MRPGTRAGTAELVGAGDIRPAEPSSSAGASKRPSPMSLPMPASSSRSSDRPAPRRVPRSGHRVGPAALRGPPSGEATDALGESPSAAQQQQLGCADAASQPLGDLGDGAILEVVGRATRSLPVRETSEGEGEVHFALRRLVVPDDRRFEHVPHPVPLRASRRDPQRDPPHPRVRHVVRGDLVPACVGGEEGLLGDVFCGGSDERPNGADDAAELQSVELDEVDLEDAADSHEQVSPPPAAR